MRITCPNCGAQYEIDEALIPAAGREVQCSACATAWFQEGQSRKSGQGTQARTVRRPSATPAAADEDSRDGAKQGTRAGSVAAKARVGGPSAVVRSDEDDGDEGAGRGGPRNGDAPVGRSDLRTEPASGASADRLGRAPAAMDADQEDDEGAPVPVPARPRPATDERTLEILREEREREDRVRAEARMRELEERKARMAAASGDPRAAAAAERERMAAAAATARARRLEAFEVQDGPTARPAQPTPATDRGRLARRELLPDIEEINSSLRPDTDRPVAGGARQPIQPTRRKTGFGTSFVATVLILLVPIAIYVLAEPIARAIPDSAAMLDAYVAQVDSLRIALDLWASNLADRIAPGG